MGVEQIGNSDFEQNEAKNDLDKLETEILQGVKKDVESTEVADGKIESVDAAIEGAHVPVEWQAKLREGTMQVIDTGTGKLLFSKNKEELEALLEGGSARDEWILDGWKWQVNITVRDGRAKLEMNPIEKATEDEEVPETEKEEKEEKEEKKEKEEKITAPETVSGVTGVAKDIEFSDISDHPNWEATWDAENKLIELDDAEGIQLVRLDGAAKLEEDQSLHYEQVTIDGKIWNITVTQAAGRAQVEMQLVSEAKEEEKGIAISESLRMETHPVKNVELSRSGYERPRINGTEPVSQYGQQVARLDMSDNRAMVDDLYLWYRKSTGQFEVYLSEELLGVDRADPDDKMFTLDLYKHTPENDRTHTYTYENAINGQKISFEVKAFLDQDGIMRVQADPDENRDDLLLEKGKDIGMPNITFPELPNWGKLKEQGKEGFLKAAELIASMVEQAVEGVERTDRTDFVELARPIEFDGKQISYLDKAVYGLEKEGEAIPEEAMEDLYVQYKDQNQTGKIWYTLWGPDASIKEFDLSKLEGGETIYQGLGSGPAGGKLEGLWEISAEPYQRDDGKYALRVLVTPPEEYINKVEKELEGKEIKRPEYDLGRPGDPQYMGVDKISSGFGVHREINPGKLHAGIDFPMPEGSPVYAAQSGTVMVSRMDSKTAVDSNKGGGYIVAVEHFHNGKRFRTLYMHLQREDALKVGATVDKGDVIAKSGSTGLATGPHLHFEVREYDPSQTDGARPKRKPVDPMEFYR